jgi:hypothetical protein
VGWLRAMFCSPEKPAMVRALAERSFAQTFGFGGICRIGDDRRRSGRGPSGAGWFGPNGEAGVLALAAGQDRRANRRRTARNTQLALEPQTPLLFSI